jgi:prepilin-type N-terminal cleavage/methylation domain-containing protein
LGIGTQGIDLIPFKRDRAFRAFSLIEVLLVLGLIGILMGLVAGNAGAFISGSNYEPPDRVLKRAALDAVYFSSEKKRKIYLSYFEDQVMFVITDSSGVIFAEHKVYAKLDEDLFEDEELIPKVFFSAIGPEAGEAGGSTSFTDRQLVLNRVAFHAGCSQPFEAKIVFRGESNTIKFDPFSGYVLADPE